MGAESAGFSRLLPQTAVTPATRAVLSVFAAAMAVLFVAHSDLSLTLGNSEWDYIPQPYNIGEGVLDRTGSLGEAIRPHGVYGPGYAIAAWAMSLPLRAFGVDDGFRSAQLVTIFASLLFLIAVTDLGRICGVPKKAEWLPPAAVACVWPFLNIAAQVTTDVLRACLLTLALATLLSAKAPRRAALAGFWLGLSLMVRGSELANLPVFLAITLLGPAGPLPWRRRWIQAGTFVAGFALGALPRVGSDFLQTGSLLYVNHAQVLRALIEGGSIGAFRPEPESLLAIVARQPREVWQAFTATFGQYLLWFLPPLGASLAITRRAPVMRRRALVVTLFVIGVFLPLSLFPAAAGRYVLALSAAVIAVGAASLLEVTPHRRLRPLLAAAAACLALLFTAEVGLLLDKYRFDLPEQDLRHALDRTDGSDPVVMVQIGVPFDRPIYLNALRYRLRRISVNLQHAPDPLDEAALLATGETLPALLLRLPIPDTGPSVILDRLRGKPRLVHLPAGIPEALRPRLLVHDPVSSVELLEVRGQAPAPSPSAAPHG